MKIDFKVEINRELLEKIIDSLGNMIRYADDGMLDRRDESFKCFFEEVDEANELLEKLNKIFGDAYASAKEETK